MLEQIDEQLDKPFMLLPERRAIPAYFRPNHRIALVLIILKYCRGEKASSTQLHVLDWAIKTPNNRRLFLRYLDGFVPPDQAVVRFDPALTRAVNYALALGLVIDARSQYVSFELMTSRLKGDRLALTKRGSEVLGLFLGEDGECLADERLFLETIGKKVTQSMVASLLEV